ncbi:MAG: HTH-type transcriptional repressor NsrR [Verrucomicrobiota bacterium]
MRKAQSFGLQDSLFDIRYSASRSPTDLALHCASFGVTSSKMHDACKLSRRLGVKRVMRLSLFTDYSLRVLMFAALKGESFSLSEVADAYGISRHHLVKVVNYLAKLGYLETRRGRGGGISLAMKPEDIRVGMVVRRTEGMPPIVECFDKDHNTCIITGSCRLKGALAQASNAFYETLDRHTLRDLVAGADGTRMNRVLLSPSS